MFRATTPTPGKLPPARAGAYVFVEDDSSSLAETKAPAPSAASAVPLVVPPSGGTLKDCVLPASRELFASPTSLSQFPGTAMVRSSMKREMKFTIGASYQIATTGAGTAPNTSVSNDLLSGLGDFLSLCAIFDEFFISSFRVVYQPVDRYEKSSSVATFVDYPLHVASIQHGAALYPTHTAAASNGALLICNSADPWSYVWKNVENKRSGSLPEPSTTSVSATQGWCLANATNAASYTGAAQILGPATYTSAPLIPLAPLPSFGLCSSAVASRGVLSDPPWASRVKHA